MHRSNLSALQNQVETHAFKTLLHRKSVRVCTPQNTRACAAPAGVRDPGATCDTDRLSETSGSGCTRRAAAGNSRSYITLCQNTHRPSGHLFPSAFPHKMCTISSHSLKNEDKFNLSTQCMWFLQKRKSLVTCPPAFCHQVEDCANEFFQTRSILSQNRLSTRRHFNRFSVTDNKTTLNLARHLPSSL